MITVLLLVKESFIYVKGMFQLAVLFHREPVNFSISSIVMVGHMSLVHPSGVDKTLSTKFLPHFHLSFILPPRDDPTSTAKFYLVFKKTVERWFDVTKRESIERITKAVQLDEVLNPAQFIQRFFNLFCIKSNGNV